MASIKRVGRNKHGGMVWDVMYRRTAKGNVIHRRIKAETRAKVERAVALDSVKSDVGLKWSEGLALYVAAKHREGRNRRGSPTPKGRSPFSPPPLATSH